MIYSWSLLGSNDNKTWTKIHSVEKDTELKICEEKSFPVDTRKSFSMFKFIQDEPEPGCWYCINIKRIEFYGSMNEENSEEISIDDEVSIIGRIK